MGNALQVEIRSLRCLIIKQQDGTLPTDEELLERQNLASVAQRALGQQAELRQGIKNDSRRGRLLDSFQDPLRRLVEFRLGYGIHRDLFVGVEIVFLGDEFDDVYAL